MYTREQVSQLRQEFWTSFGRYLSPLLSAEGLKVNWINYKTGIKHLYFRMQADKKTASIAIEITHPDTGIQELYFEQFKEYENILKSVSKEDWEWVLHARDEHGKIISRIYKEIGGLNVLRREDWPALISFFKPRIIALDEFWANVKYGFESLK